MPSIQVCALQIYTQACRITCHGTCICKRESRLTQAHTHKRLRSNSRARGPLGLDLAVGVGEACVQHDEGQLWLMVCPSKVTIITTATTTGSSVLPQASSIIIISLEQFLALFRFVVNVVRCCSEALMCPMCPKPRFCLVWF